MKTYRVAVQRTETRTAYLEVQANSRDEASDKATELAYDTEFSSGPSADYEVIDIELLEKEENKV